MLEITNNGKFGKVIADSLSKIELTRTSAQTKKRWINAIAKAVAEIEQNGVFMTRQEDDQSLLIWSQKSNNIYLANGVCQCRAFEQGSPCFHHAAAPIGLPLFGSGKLSELNKEEKKQKNVRFRLRVQMLRLLKSGQLKQVKEVSRVLGISPKHGYHLWHRYEKEGLAKYLSLDYKARQAKLKASEQAKLMKKAESGYISQAAAREYIEKEFGVSYTQQGISVLFQRLKIKAKVARPENILSDKREQAEYKKTLPHG